MRLTLLSLLAVVATTGAMANILIDDFADGERSIVIQSGSEQHVDSATVLGGFRGLYAFVNDNPLGQNFGVRVAEQPGFAIINSGTLTDGTAQFAYGYNPSFTFTDLNADFSSEDRLQLGFLSNDLDLGLTVEFRSSSVGGGTWFSENYIVLTNLNSFNFDVMFSDFPGMDFSDVDQIVFTFSPAPSGDFTLTQIEAVPEPATMLALGAGLAALAARRRRKA